MSSLIDVVGTAIGVVLFTPYVLSIGVVNWCCLLGCVEEMNILKGGILCVSIAAFTGCSVLCPKQPPVYVSAPISAPPVLVRPSLKINEIVQDTPDGVVVQYWRATVEQLINYSKQLEDIVESYRQMSKENKK